MKITESATTRTSIGTLARKALRVVTGGGPGGGKEGGAADAAGEKSAREERAERERMLADYRKLLFGAGDESVSEKGGFTRARVEAILKAGGKLTTAELLRCRVRHFTEGLVLGSRSFVNRYFEAARENFGARRTSGARKVRGSDAAGLYALRDLRKAAITGR